MANPSGTPVYDTLRDPPVALVQTISEGLDTYNRAAVGNYSYTRLVVVARHPADLTRLVGGLFGDLLWGWFHIEALWVDQAWRGRGVGSRLLQQAETAAGVAGITRIHLETTSFQALDFYRRHGYTVFATLPDKPPGATWYYLTKVPATEED